LPSANNLQVPQENSADLSTSVWTYYSETASNMAESTKGDLETNNKSPDVNTNNKTNLL